MVAFSIDTEGGKIIPERKEDKELEGILKQIETWQPISEEIKRRLLVLNMHPMTEGESNRERGSNLRHTLEVYKYCQKMIETLPELQPIEKELKLAALTHDIGKSGPDFDPDNYTAREKITGFASMRLFSLLESKDEEVLAEQKIEDVLKKHVSKEEAEFIMENLSNLGLTPDDLMRDFYNTHLNNTIDILRNGRVPEKVVWIAGNHHAYGRLKDEEMPSGIDEKTTELLNKASLVLQIVDSFEAAKARVDMSDSENIERLLERYKDNEVAKEIIEKVPSII